jgi:hypothetical protein
MNSDDLIDKLTEDLSPVSEVLSVRREARRIALLALAYSFVSLIVLGIPRLGSGLAFGPLWIAVFGSTLTAVLSGLSVLYTCVPGHSRVPLSLILAVLSLFSWTLALVLISWSEGLGNFAGGLDCSLIVLGLSLPPLFVQARLIAKLAPTRPWLTGSLAGLTATSLGCAGLSFFCPNHHPGHILEWHLFLPAITLGAVSAAAAVIKIRW